jgi:hypothetical protein
MPASTHVAPSTPAAATSSANAKGRRRSAAAFGSTLKAEGEGAPKAAGRRRSFNVAALTNNTMKEEPTVPCGAVYRPLASPLRASHTSPHSGVALAPVRVDAYGSFSALSPTRRPNISLSPSNASDPHRDKLQRAMGCTTAEYSSKVPQWRVVVVVS